MAILRRDSWEEKMHQRDMLIRRQMGGLSWATTGISSQAPKQKPIEKQEPNKNLLLLED